MNEIALVARRRKVSVRYYGFEETLWQMPGFAGLTKPMSLAQLQLCAGYVWAREGGKGACPIVASRKATDHSYWIATNNASGSIYLARRHRNLGGLLHEMAHALGRRDKQDHGPAFRKRCLRFYREYGGWDGKVDL